VFFDKHAHVLTTKLLGSRSSKLFFAFEYSVFPEYFGAKKLTQKYVFAITYMRHKINFPSFYFVLERCFEKLKDRKN